MINTVFVVLTWFIGLAATVGPVAAIIGIIAFPAIVVPLISRIAKAFFDCVPCIIATAVVLACVGSYWVGHHDAVSDCREAELAAELRNRNIDLENASKARSDETNRANTIEADADEQRKKDLAYIEALKNRPICSLEESETSAPSNRRPNRK